jgi:hypothetical protein
MAMRGLLRFWLRGIEKVKGEWSLWCLTHNLLKLWRSGWRSGQNGGNGIVPMTCAT